MKALEQPATSRTTCDVQPGLSPAPCSAAKRAREVLLYCKLWTQGDMELPHLKPEKKCLEHRISIIEEAIKQLDALPQNAELSHTRTTKTP